MSKPLVRFQLAVSLDGLIGPHDGSVDWLSPYEALGDEVMTPFMKEIGGLVMGRLTYEKMLELSGWPFGDMPTVVLSTSTELKSVPGMEVTALGPRAAVESLQARVTKGDIWLVGGGKTATSFLKEGLLDRIELTTVPVILGSGLALFGDLDVPTTFEFLSSTVCSQGAILSIYAKRA